MINGLKMENFTNRIDGVSNDLGEVDKRHNLISEETVQTLEEVVDKMQSRIQIMEIEQKKTIRKYQVIIGIVIFAFIAELVYFL